MDNETLDMQNEQQEVETEQEQLETEQTEQQTISETDILTALKEPTGAVKEYLDNLIKEAVKTALASTTPRRTTVKVEPITKEQFDKMTYAEREKLFNENRELYNKFTR